MLRSPIRATSIIVTVLALGALSNACGSTDESAVNQSGFTLDRVEQEAIKKYRWYLEETATSLVDWTRQLRGQIAASEVAKAQSRYATSRVQYGQLLLSPKFAGLDLAINGHAGRQPGSTFVGFHRIEKGLFGQETTAGLKPVAKRLALDVGRLHHAVKTAELSPLQIADVANDVLDEVATLKVTGKEEPYSHIDMVDVSASVEGLEAAFDALRPLLVNLDVVFVQRIECRFVSIYEQIQPTGTPGREPQPRSPAAGAFFINYSEIPEANIQGIGQSIRRLARLYKQIPRTLESA